MSPASPLPSPLDVQPFAVRDALRLGVTACRLRSRDLDRSIWGARSPADASPADPPDDLLRSRCRAYLTVAPPGARFSHATAARLLGLPLPKRLDADARLDVAVAADQPQPRHMGVRGHRIVRDGDDRPFVVDGLPLVRPDRVWLQLAPLLGVAELVVAGDLLCRRDEPLLDVDVLRRRVGRSSGVRDIRRARAALDLIRPGTESPMESVLRLALLRQGLPEPTVGVAVFDRSGRYVGRPDLAYPHARIAIEYEGDVHRIDRATFVEDIRRRERFENAGWTVVRVVSDHLTGDARALTVRIRRLLVRTVPPSA